MAQQNLAAVSTVSSMLRTNSVLVEIGGAVRRITLDKLMDAINSEQEGILRQVAWGTGVDGRSDFHQLDSRQSGQPAHVAGV